ncbi:type II toxin-antitoxin system PemK/MazF family toxin [uncultured Megasphaera sp.]|uniref:type II toxin-antitoxin system PemK/MazF family toxin n=1 Tax=uncultured Megasphaera sp. TaxID=165188 RepID=UPI00260D3EE9|nr:type II toxin-antitoxin system PemK/MazF family toxin [uncultured Megasphaera sp.]
MTKWEIWWAYVKFEDSNEVKRRPVLILDNQIACILSLKITSHEPRKNFNGEYQILQWEKAGLTKPSVVRLSKPLCLQKRDFGDKIGKLSDADILSIQTLLTFYSKKA